MFSANSSQVSDSKLFVEDVFSTYLYTGNGSTQTITNGIDLAGKGGLVWMKSRSVAGQNHILTDTVKGATKRLSSNLPDPQYTYAGFGLTGFGSSGFTLTDTSGGGYDVNGSGSTYASWTFREAPKFFDIVTYTGDGVAGRQIAHSLGSTPGMMIVKQTSGSFGWAVYHRSLGGTDLLALEDTGATNSSPIWWNNTIPTSTNFTVGTSGRVNASGATYVAYLFAHDAGGFGNSGTDSIISCGSFTTDSNGVANVTLGWEPQFVITKRTNGAQSWQMADVMRGQDNTGTNLLYADLTNADFRTSSLLPCPNATGFSSNSGSFFGNSTYIYMAIRRGPMRTPTLGTSVFVPSTRTGTGTTTVVSSTTFPPDLLITRPYASNDAPAWFDRLRGRSKCLLSNSVNAETTTTTTTNDLISFNMNGITVGANQQQAVNTNGAAIVDWNLRRAPGFFDVVCYTGNFSFRAINHNLGVVPELIITKARTDNNAFPAWYTPTTLGASTYNQLLLQDTGGLNIYSYGFGSSLGSNPTSELIYLGQNDQLNGVGPYVAYLFASCPGVSKVGEYTGNGTSQTINCGFAAGARFVMIKRTGSINSDWYVWDTARGIVAGNDPHLSLNTTVAQVTTDDTIDTDSSGFVVNQVAATNVNVNAATYIYLAIA